MKLEFNKNMKNYPYIVKEVKEFFEDKKEIFEEIDVSSSIDMIIVTFYEQSNDLYGYSYQIKESEINVSYKDLEHKSIKVTDVDDAFNIIWKDLVDFLEEND